MKRMLLTIEADNRSSRDKHKKDSREITKNMIRVRSSNVWSYAFDIEQGYDLGTLYVQFKDERSRPGDIYRYYGVPYKIYHKLVAAPSKGHAFWKYIRNKYQYSKLTGDKRGKLKNAVNAR